MGRILFFTEGTSYRIEGKGVLRQWMSKTVKKEGFTLGDLNIILCDDNFLLKLNKKYLKKKTLTDIITFPDDGSGKIAGGEIYISIDRIKENAKQYGIRISDELSRIIIHGILHLAGYKDGTEDEKRTMREREEKYLKTLRKGKESVILS